MYFYTFFVYMHEHTYMKNKTKAKTKTLARTAKPIAIIHESKIYLFEFMYDSIFRQTVHADRQIELYVNICVYIYV